MASTLKDNFNPEVERGHCPGCHGKKVELRLDSDRWTCKEWITIIQNTAETKRE